MARRTIIAASILAIFTMSSPAFAYSNVSPKPAQSMRSFSEGREIKVDIPARINRVYGRQLSIVGPDGKPDFKPIYSHAGLPTPSFTAEQMLDALDGKPVTRIVNPQVWPAYAKRFELAFGFAPRR